MDSDIQHEVGASVDVVNKQVPLSPLKLLKGCEGCEGCEGCSIAFLLKGQSRSFIVYGVLRLQDGYI
jgi:hypothetical protein